MTATTNTSPLKVRVLNGSDQHDGFGVNSSVVYGEKEAVIVDTQFTLANAHRLVAEALETGCKVTTIYISHFHPDHFLGTSVVHAAFPEARVVSLPDCGAVVNEAYDFKIRYWGTEVLGINGSKTKVNIEYLDEPVIMLEGQRLEILGPLQGDSEHQSAVWIPCIRTLIACDTVFSGAHVWMADAKTPELRKDWLDVLDRLEALKPEVVIPGHAPDASHFSPDAIGYTRDYIKEFEQVARDARDSAEIIATMMQRHPGLSTFICLNYSAKIIKDRYPWPGEWPQSLRDLKPVL